MLYLQAPRHIYGMCQITDRLVNPFPKSTLTWFGGEGYGLSLKILNGMAYTFLSDRATSDAPTGMLAMYKVVSFNFAIVDLEILSEVLLY